ncbi:MAG: MOP flippase family protein [Pseudomonadota bacterium]
MSDLKTKTISALIWSSTDKAGVYLLQFVMGIVLARLLEPADFGLVGMLTIFLVLIQIFTDGGLSAALIQKKEPTNEEFSTIFYFNVLSAALGAGILFLCAPLVAGFYNEPLLDPLTKVLSLNLVFGSFGLVQSTRMTKRLDFRTQTKITLIATASSGFFAIMAALHGFGVWSLVIRELSGNVVRTTLFWMSSDWRPSPAFSIRRLREMLGFGSRLLASSLLFRLVDQADLVVIGKAFSAQDLGFYTRAGSLARVAPSGFSVVVNRVTFPVFSTIQDEPRRLKNGLKKILRVLALINLPAMTGLFVVALPTVELLLTPKWTPCVPYVRLLCLVGLLHPLHVINLPVLLAMGRSDLYLRLAIIKAVLTLSNAAVAWRFGIEALIWGQVALSIVCYYVNSYYTGILIGYSFLEQVRDLFPYLLGAVAMAVVIYPVKWLVPNNNLALLACQTVFGGLIYIGICRVFKLAGYMEVRGMLRSRMSAVTMARIS